MSGFYLSDDYNANCLKKKLKELKKHDIQPRGAIKFFASKVNGFTVTPGKVIDQLGINAAAYYVTKKEANLKHFKGSYFGQW